MILQHCILPIANYIANYIRTYFILHNVVVCDFLVIAHAQCTSAIPCVEPTFDSSFTSSPVCWTCVLPTFDSCTQEEPSAADLNCADQRLSMEGLVPRLVLLLQFTMHCIAMADDGGWSCYYNHNGTRWCLGLWTCRCCLAYKFSKTSLTAILNIFRIVGNKMNSVVQKQLLKCANIFRHFESDLCGLAWQCLHLLWNCANIAPLSFQITL